MTLAAPAILRRRLLQGALSVGVLAACARRAAAAGQVVVVNRDRNIRDEIVSDFADRNRIEVDYQVVETEAEIYDRARDARPFDVIIVPDRLLDRLGQEERLAPLDPARLPGLSNIAGDFAEPVYDPGMRFGAPYLWGTWGVGFTELRASRPRDWDEVFGSDLYAGDIHLPAVPELIRLIMKIRGGSANETDPAAIEEAAQALLEMRPAVKSFTPDTGVDLLSVGQVALAVTESRKIQPRILTDGSLGYVVPRSGSLLWVDSLAIGKDAADPEAAYAFIEHILDPERHARIAASLRAGCPNGPGLVYVPQEQRLDRSIYPQRETIRRSEAMRWTGHEAEALYAAAIERVRVG